MLQQPAEHFTDIFFGLSCVDVLNSSLCKDLLISNQVKGRQFPKAIRKSLM